MLDVEDSLNYVEYRYVRRRKTKVREDHRASPMVPKSLALSWRPNVLRLGSRTRRGGKACRLLVDTTASADGKRLGGTGKSERPDMREVSVLEVM